MIARKNKMRATQITAPFVPRARTLEIKSSTKVTNHASKVEARSYREVISAGACIVVLAALGISLMAFWRWFFDQFPS